MRGGCDEVSANLDLSRFSHDVERNRQTQAESARGKNSDKHVPAAICRAITTNSCALKTKDELMEKHDASRPTDRKVALHVM